jgi:hypothetical protein
MEASCRSIQTHQALDVWPGRMAAFTGAGEAQRLSPDEQDRSELPEKDTSSTLRENPKTEAPLSPKRETP